MDVRYYNIASENLAMTHFFSRLALSCASWMTGSTATTTTTTGSVFVDQGYDSSLAQPGTVYRAPMTITADGLYLYLWQGKEEGQVVYCSSPSTHLWRYR
jgi:hypothetical protein